MKNMTRFELETTIKELGCTYGHHQAMSGSQYITINSIRYRLADHTQPSHYQIRNYIDCNSNDQILQLVLNQIEESKKVNTVDEFLYDESDDSFFRNENYMN